MDFDFSTATVVDSLDGVPEQFRPLYEAKDGKHALASADPKVKGAVEAVLALTRALKAERATKRPTVDLSPLKDFGETPEAVRAKIDEMTETIAKNSKIDPKKIKEEMALQFKKDLDGKEAKIAILRKTLNTHLIDSALKSAIAAEKGDVDLLLPFARERMAPLEDENGYSAVVVDETGNVRYSGTTAKPLTPHELVKEMKMNPKFGRLFESNVNSGSGARPGAAARNQNSRNETADKSSVDKIAAGLASRK